MFFVCHARLASQLSFAGAEAPFSIAFFNSGEGVLTDFAAKSPGKSGLRVSEGALGTMTFGDERGWGSPKDEAQKVYETYRERHSLGVKSLPLYLDVLTRTG
jgi:hypothetical protein